MALFDSFDRYMFNRMNDFFREEADQPYMITSDTSDGRVMTTPRRGGMLGAKLDLLEKPNEYVFTVELPGVRKEDIQVHVENGMLSLMAERKEEKKEEKDRYHYSERRFGSIKRMVSLPEQANPDNCKAQFENGVLTLAFEKRPEGSGRKQVTIS